MRAGADRTVEMLPQRRMMLTDARHRLAERSRYAHSSPLACGSGSSVATTEPNCAGQLAKDEVAFGTCLRGSPRIVHCLRILDVFLDVGETPAVRLLRSCIEHLASVPQSGA